ncbi:MAG: GntR family transcriptional regulator [Oscillospiraceae bacterium]
MDNRTLISGGNPHEKSMQIAEKILAYIKTNKIPPDKRLPSENKLAEQFGVNRNIVRTAYSHLCSQGYVTSVQGKGHFPARRARPLIYKHSSTIGFSEIFGKKYDEYENKIVSWTKTEVKPNELARFGLEEGEMIYRLRTLRLVKGEVIAVCYSNIPAKHVPDFEEHFENYESINRIFMENYGYEHPVCDSISVKAANANSDDLKYLGISENTPVITIASTFSTAQTGVIEYFIIHAAGDKFILNMDFKNEEKADD